VNANGNYNGPLYAITGTYFADPWQGYNIAAVGTASALTFTFVDTEHNGIVCTGTDPMTHFGTRHKLIGQFRCTGQGLNPAPTPATIDSYHTTGQGIEGRLTTTTVNGCNLSLRFAAVFNN